MGLPLRDTGYHTYADYLTWGESARFELIDGAAYAMAPAPTRVHQEILLELARQVADALEGSPCRPYIAPFDVRLPKGEEADERIDTVVQPDLAVVCDPLKLDEHGCRGTPDWVVEVLSPATSGYDQILKLAVYERVGVPEYWLVHPVDRVVTVYRLEDGAYGRPAIRETRESLAVASLPQIVIDWDRVFRGQPPMI